MTGRRAGYLLVCSLAAHLDCVHTLSVERRLSRYAYLAEKPHDT